MPKRLFFSVSGKIYGHNQLRSCCFQVQSVTCWHLSVFLYQFEVYFIDSSKTINNYLELLSFNWGFLKLKFVLQLICRFVSAIKFQISIIIKFPNLVKLWLQVARLASPLWNLAQLDWNRLISTLNIVFLNGIWVASLPSRKSKGEKICMPS